MRLSPGTRLLAVESNTTRRPSSLAHFQGLDRNFSGFKTLTSFFQYETHHRAICLLGGFDLQNRPDHVTSLAAYGKNQPAAAPAAVPILDPFLIKIFLREKRRHVRLDPPIHGHRAGQVGSMIFPYRID